MEEPKKAKDLYCVDTFKLTGYTVTVNDCVISIKYQQF